MLRSITKYRYITKKTLKKQLKKADINNPYVRTSGRAYVKNLKQLGCLIKKHRVRFSSPNKKGIPQGTAVSAILANIYMCKFDIWLSELVKQKKGIYRRYSDDFIIVIPLPRNKAVSIVELKNEIVNYSQNKIQLTIEQHKTQLLFYSKENKAVFKYQNNTFTPSSIVYLGFCFDGVSVSLKPGSLYRFVYRSKRSVNRYIAFMDAYKRYLDSKGPSEYVLKYSTGGNKAYRKNNNTENYMKRKLYLKASIAKPNYIFTYHKEITKRFLATRCIEPRSSMLSYACRAQHLFQYKTHGKYQVVIYKQVVRQIIRNQKKLGAFVND